MESEAAGRGGDPGRDVDEFAADRWRRRACHALVSGQGGGGPGQVERHDGAGQPGGVGIEHARGQVRQRGGFQVGVDVLDDRVRPVGFVRCHGVVFLYGCGGEERVESPGIEQAPLPVRGFRVQIGDATHYEPARHLLVLLLRGECGEVDLGDFGAGDPSFGVFVVDRVGVVDRGPGVVGDGGDGAFDRRVQADGESPRV